MRLRLLSVCAFYLANVTTAYANPVSFKDGYGVMPTVTPDWSDVQLNYSVTNFYSVGLSNYYRHGGDRSTNFELGQFNYLFRRWNELESQANIYGSVGLGARHDSKLNESFAGFAAVEADYETRRVYTLFSAEALQSPGSADFHRLRYRAGVAPYKAPIDGLHTWVILQLDYMPEMDQELTTTPLLRFFYNNYALEAGCSFDGQPYFGLMAHF